jgi:hypothetical protein
VPSHHSGIRRADTRERPRPPASRLDDDDKTQVRAPSLLALAKLSEDSFDELTPPYASSPSERAPAAPAMLEPPSNALTRKLQALREALVPLPPPARTPAPEPLEPSRPPTAPSSSPFAAMRKLTLSNHDAGAERTSRPSAPEHDDSALARAASEAASDTLPPDPPSTGSLSASAFSALPLDARRVAVLATPDGQAIVRPIGDGEAAPPGAQLALLVALDGGSRLFVARP